MERVEIEGTYGERIDLRACATGCVRLEVSDQPAHLTRAQATQLRDALSAFIEEGA